MSVFVRDAAFDPWTEIARHVETAPALAGRFGATAVFVGTCRDLNQGHAVHAMTLEHYAGMTERELGKIEAEARGHWQILDALTVHRIGDIRPNDPIVLVAVWASHRHDAFGACREIMEALKTRAPFWKREATDHGPRWVGAGDPL
ncbi:MAG: molybdenum cofactor biosynthesis protein MoaE [Acidiferrobacteraceae bacterium]